MVYNPPIVLIDGKVKDGGVAHTHPVNPMRRGAYVEQATRATGWAAIYIIGWLLMRLSCYIGLPDDCKLANDPLEVLANILVLLVLCLVQSDPSEAVYMTYSAEDVGISSYLPLLQVHDVWYWNWCIVATWFCEVIEERRFRDLTTKVYFPLVVVLAALAISGLSLVETLRSQGRRLTNWQITIFVVMLVITALAVMYHFSEAWKVLPGAHLISGTSVPRVQIEEDLLSIYLVSRLLILAFAILYAAFALARDDGFGYELYVLAWLLSLFAQFKTDISILWLAITTGVFLQGIGAYSLAFLCDDRVQ